MGQQCWEIIDGPEFKHIVPISMKGTRLSLSIPVSGGIWSIKYYTKPYDGKPTTIYIVLPLAGAEIASNIRQDLQNIRRVAENLDWPFAYPLSYLDCAFSIFSDNGRGDFRGMAQPFHLLDPLNQPRPLNASTWEFNFPRSDVYTNEDDINNSIATWFGLKTDTATLNYFYAGHALGIRGREDPRYLEAADTLLTGALLNSGKNISAKYAAFAAGLFILNETDYMINGPRYAMGIYKNNMGEVKAWMDMMVPNLVPCKNYFLNPPCLYCDVINIQPPLFIYLNEEEINRCNDHEGK